LLSRLIKGYCFTGKLSVA